MATILPALFLLVVSPRLQAKRGQPKKEKEAMDISLCLDAGACI